MDDVRKPDGSTIEEIKPPFVISRPKLDYVPSTLSEEGRRWVEDNREAIDAFNEWYEVNGSPLDRFRQS